mgnify:CR=1 FL=1
MTDAASQAAPQSQKKPVAVAIGEKIEGFMGDVGKRIENIVQAACVGNRDNVVMVRVNDAALQRVDDLLEAEIFKSRSEAAAFLLQAGIQSQQALFEQISEKVAEIKRIREELRRMAGR